MDIMTLAATITLNSKGFTDGLSGAENGLAKLGKSIVNTTAMLKVAEAGFNSIKKVVSGAVEGYANYEQLVGGVQTLFGTASQKVQEYANKAYETAGLSANQYMETVTSFSASLLQGLKGDTQTAADVANMAVTDMADNANKMGTDMTMIQNAYMGFAKGNFTMLDNLKLGYGGTKKEMVRLINDSGVLDKKIKKIDQVSFADMIKAIHKIQEEMGITGTTAEEASATIQGSAAAMRSAWENLLTFSGAEDEGLFKEAQDKFVESFSTYFNNNLAPRIIAGLKGSDEVFMAIATAITKVPDGTLSEMVAGGLEGATGLINGLTTITDWVFDEIVGVFQNPEVTIENAKELGSAIGAFAGNLVRQAATHLPDMVWGLFDIGVNFAGGIIDGITAGLLGQAPGTVAGELNKISKEEQKSIDEANKKAAKANGIIDWLDELQEKYGEAASNMPEWEAAMKGLFELSEGYSIFFEEENKNLKTNTESMREYTKEKRNLTIQEAADRALSEKQALVDDLEIQRQTAMINQQMNEHQMAAAAEMLGNEITEKLGLGKRGLSVGMNPEEFTNIVKDVLTAAQIRQGRTPGVDVPAITNWDTQMYLGDNGQVTFESLFLVANDLNSMFKDLGINSDGLAEQYEANKKAVEESKTKIETTEKELETARLSLNIATTAVDNWVASLRTATLALHSFPQIPGGSTRNGHQNLYSHATGLDRVPYDGYIAELHKDEAVLTRAEAGEWRRGGSGEFDYNRMAESISAAIVSGMSRVGFYFDKDQVAAAIAPNVSETIADGMAAWGYS